MGRFLVVEPKNSKDLDEVVCGVDCVGDRTGKLKNRRNLVQALVLGYFLVCTTRTGVGDVLILCRRGESQKSKSPPSLLFSVARAEKSVGRMGVGEGTTGCG